MQWKSSAIATRAALAAGLLAVAAACAGRSDVPAAPQPAAPVVQAPPTLDEHGVPVGLSNYRRWSDKLAQGAAPEGDEAFRNLAALGFKTILTVDGSRPDVETAERYGLHYVHVPIGYDGVPKEAQLKIVRAVEVSDGPVYVHCHHGTARGPAACAVVRVALEGATNAEASEGLKESGCAPVYKGLFRDVAACAAPTAEELARVPANLPSYVPPGDVAVAMVGADMRFDRIKLSKSAKWGVPADHPDVDPPHEATMLWEQFKEIARLDDAKRRGGDFLELLSAAEKSAKELEGAIQSGDVAAADAAQNAVKQRCDACHAKYRNN